MGRRKLIVLDRDGVINADSDDYIKSADEWQALPGSLEAIARLGRGGYEVVIATNQSGIGRGLLSAATLESIHARMHQEVETAGGRIAKVYVCPHHPDDGCGCRKPKPGLLEQIAADFETRLDGVPFVGDKVSDVEAAVAAGARPIFVQTSNRKADLQRLQQLGAEVHRDLASAVDALLAE